MKIGNKIHQFEALPEHKLKLFNQVFEFSPLEGQDDDEVEIGDILGPATTRVVYVNGKPVKHSFEPVYPFGDERMYVKELETNEELSNQIMSEEEMKLEPIQYMLLQYLRGCQRPFHTKLEIADKLNKSAKNIGTVLRGLEERNVLKTRSIPSMHKLEITLNEEWA
jgi:hypothetical protein